MSDKKEDLIEYPSKKFGYEVPIFTPSIYRDYSGESFTTFHSENHLVMRHIHYDKREISIYGGFYKSYKGTLKELQYDNKIWKLVQASVGDIYLIVLDMRKNSQTFGDWESFIITEKDRNQVLVPPGFASGYYALTDCMFHYNLFHSEATVKDNEQGTVKWNDPEYQIEWPTDRPILQGGYR
jgi:dTDP-4-dehydrorhamnose 3,5-epimerase